MVEVLGTLTGAEACSAGRGEVQPDPRPQMHVLKSMNEGQKVSEEELAFREELRIANIEFERVRSEADRAEVAEALERGVRKRIKRLAEGFQVRSRDADAEGV
jgi:hypothetical protein